MLLPRYRKFTAGVF